ncbi:MAG: hypothetical protein IPJ51_10745 [Saprospiraceae bacterium]|nr:hypothetical protein [Saprospiraceae bacterium]
MFKVGDRVLISKKESSRWAPHQFKYLNKESTIYDIGLRRALLEIDRGQNLWRLEDLIKVQSAHEVLTEAELERINKLNHV